MVCGLVLGSAGLTSYLRPPAQGKTIRLEGDGLLGPEADEHRGTRSGYGYEGTPPSIVPAMIELAGISKDDVVYEPGCGDARSCRGDPGRREEGLGVDIDPDLAEVAYAKVKAAGLADRIEIHWGNALDIDMSESHRRVPVHGRGVQQGDPADAVEAASVGARVVSNDFAMGDWTPDKTVRVDTPGRSYVLYLWTITPEIKERKRPRRPGDSNTSPK